MAERLDELIDKMFELRESKRELDARSKELGQEYAALEARLIERLDEVGTETSRGQLASVTITEQLVPRIEDWGAVEEYVMNNDAIYLLHRRVSSGPWKELLDTGENVPGITPFTKRAISLRKRGD